MQSRNRYYLDEDISYRVAEIVRRRSSIDITTTREQGRNGTPDEEQLRFATEQRRCIVTRNYTDFVRIVREYIATCAAHAGVLLVPESIPNNDLVGIAAAIVQHDRDNPDGIPPNMTEFLRWAGH